MSTRTPNLNLINPVASEKGALTTYVTNNNAIDTAYGQSLENVAPIEGSTASKNYAIGTYMVKDGGLYKVTAAIATGETITVGTNVTPTSLNEAVADLNSAVATLSTKIGNVGNTSLQSQVSMLQDSVYPQLTTSQWIQAYRPGGALPTIELPCLMQPSFVSVSNVSVFVYDDDAWHDTTMSSWEWYGNLLHIKLVRDDVLFPIGALRLIRMTLTVR